MGIVIEIINLYKGNERYEEIIRNDKKIKVRKLHSILNLPHKFITHLHFLSLPFRKPHNPFTSSDFPSVLSMYHFQSIYTKNINIIFCLNKYKKKLTNYITKYI